MQQHDELFRVMLRVTSPTGRPYTYFWDDQQYTVPGGAEGVVLPAHIARHLHKHALNQVEPLKLELQEVRYVPADAQKFSFSCSFPGCGFTTDDPAGFQAHVMGHAAELNPIPDRDAEPAPAAPAAKVPAAKGR